MEYDNNNFIIASWAYLQQDKHGKGCGSVQCVLAIVMEVVVQRGVVRNSGTRAVNGVGIVAKLRD